MKITDGNRRDIEEIREALKGDGFVPQIKKRMGEDVMTKAVKQLADWLLTEPNDGNPLCFAGPPEPAVLGLSRVKMRSVTGTEWTLIAGLQEGWLTAEQRAANFWRIAKLERAEVAREDDAQVDALLVLEMIAADDDFARSNGQPLLTPGVRIDLDAALIKAGRKEAPVRTGE
ncbi:MULTISPECIES: hypothetical protein [Burkholderia]|uniref:Uncharacterized protein n=1 Tax=Burkholderia pyrrocinia TaxID=60550 RepID=A0A318J366_BURPY|nr:MULTISPECIES: hypothetical protein [Burkholderia]PXX41120.1 hypothetical protein NA66_1001730 [Burkholderia pyrrocinia]SFW58459.1 hypothetical protein SAMN03159384_03046 [Burkholderia sp. NFACC33-1]SFY11914.1 hypothetical protein SAMN03159408_03258 [Burkholderia sp. NFPP32]